MPSITVYLTAFAGYIALTSAGPLEQREAGPQPVVLATGLCNHDNLYRSMIDPRFSSSASAFCSAFIMPTAFVAATVTTTATVTTNVVAATFSDTITQAPYAPRAVSTNPATFSTFPASRLSSACSCILTAAPATTTITSTTVTVPVTATATATTYEYSLKWNENGCGYAYPNINDYPQPGLTEQQAIDDCMYSCTNDPNCLLFEAYFDISTLGDNENLPRCATFGSSYDSSHLLCPVPGYDIAYSVGAGKNL